MDRTFFVYACGLLEATALSGDVRALQMLATLLEAECRTSKDVESAEALFQKAEALTGDQRVAPIAA